MIKKEIIYSIITITLSSIFAFLLLEIALRIAVKNPNLKVKIFPTNVGWNENDFNKQLNTLHTNLTTIYEKFNIKVFNFCY